MTLQEILNLCNYAANKEQSGNTLSPEQYNIILKAVNLYHFKRKIGLTEEYSIGKPMPQQALEITQRIADDLSPFLVQLNPLTIDVVGEADLPTNYFYPVNIGYDYVDSNGTKYNKAVEVLKQHELEIILGNSLKQPTKKNPACIIYDTYIQFYPIDLVYVRFNYYRLPNTPVYAYTIDINDNIIYNAAGSTELEWNELNQLDIAALILKEIGVNLQMTNLYQYAETMKIKGV